LGSPSPEAPAQVSIAEHDFSRSMGVRAFPCVDLGVRAASGRPVYVGLHRVVGERSPPGSDRGLGAAAVGDSSTIAEFRSAALQGSPPFAGARPPGSPRPRPAPPPGLQSLRPSPVVLLAMHPGGFWRRPRLWLSRVLALGCFPGGMLVLLCCLRVRSRWLWWLFRSGVLPICLPMPLASTLLITTMHWRGCRYHARLGGLR